MTLQDWWTILDGPEGKDSLQGFALWLQDEADEPLKAQAIQWMIDNDKWPVALGNPRWTRWREENDIWMDEEENERQKSILPKTIFNYLEDRKRKYHILASYSNPSDAIKDLIYAWERRYLWISNEAKSFS